MMNFLPAILRRVQDLAVVLLAGRLLLDYLTWKYLSVHMTQPARPSTGPVDSEVIVRS